MYGNPVGWWSLPVWQADSLDCIAVLVHHILGLKDDAKASLAKAELMLEVSQVPAHDQYRDHKTRKGSVSWLSV